MPDTAPPPSRVPHPPPVLKILVWSIALLALLHGCTFMFDQTQQYLQFRDDVGFLRLKKQYHHLPYWKPAFYTHVFTAIFALLAAFTQFLPIRSRSHAKLHRIAGRLYVFVILLLAAPTGFFLCFFAEGGIAGRFGFFSLAVLWFFTTAAGLAAILRRKVSTHLEWMTRSYALTFAAITFREWQHWSPYLFPAGFEPTPITAWLAWVPNLLLAELWIHHRRRTAS